MSEATLPPDFPKDMTFLDPKESEIYRRIILDRRLHETQNAYSQEIKELIFRSKHPLLHYFPKEK